MAEDSAKITLDEETDEFKVINKQWKEEAGEQTLETIGAFLTHLMDDYVHDYGTVVHAITAGAIGAAKAMDHHEEQGGITGFQASFVMWGFVQQWLLKEGPMRMIDYNEMLSPQYEDKFQKTISANTWKWLQNTAKERLSEPGGVDPVREHWASIVAGVVPFGYTVEEG